MPPAKARERAEVISSKRRGQALGDDGRDRLAVDRGLAEVELDQAPEVAPELHRHGGVEAVEAAQALDHGRVAAAHLPDQRVDGVARRELEQQEQAGEDQEQRRDARREPPQGEAEDAHLFR